MSKVLPVGAETVGDEVHDRAAPISSAVYSNRAHQYDFKYDKYESRLQAEMEWECAVKSWNCHSRHDYRALAIELMHPFPREFNLERPISIENCSLISGLWRVWSFSECGHWLYIQIHEDDEYEQFPPKREWEVQRVSNIKEGGEDIPCGLMICSRSDYDPTKPTIVRMAPMLMFRVHAVIISITQVDTAEQRFNSDVYCEFKIPSVSSCENRKTVEHALHVYGLNKHMIEFLNGDGSMETWTKFYTSLDNPYYYDFSYNCRCKGTFNEEFELQSFPFDIQDLTITVAIAKNAEYIRFVPDEKVPSTFVYSQFQLNNLFNVIYKDMAMERIQLSDPISSASGVSFPVVHYQLKLQRSPWFYINNIAIPTMILTYVSFVSFTIDSDGAKIGTADRLSVTLTLLLTAVAYKFAVASSLPKVSYITILDGYILSCFGVTIIVAVLNCLFPYLEWRYQSNSTLVSEWEYYCVVMVIALFTLYNIALAVIWGKHLMMCHSNEEKRMVVERTRRVVNSVHRTKSAEERKQIAELALKLRHCKRTMQNMMAGEQPQLSKSEYTSLASITEGASLEMQSIDPFQLSYINKKVDRFNAIRNK